MPAPAAGPLSAAIVTFEDSCSMTTMRALSVSAAAASSMDGSGSGSWPSAPGRAVRSGTVAHVAARAERGAGRGEEDAADVGVGLEALEDARACTRTCRGGARCAVRGG